MVRRLIEKQAGESHKENKTTREKKKKKQELKGPPILPGGLLYCKYAPLGGNQCKRQLAAGA